jgi:electron transfer flavoprotein alpha subunit
MKIYTFLQQNDGKPNRNSLEALAAAQQLAEQTGGSVSAIVFGTDIETFTKYDLAEIIQVQNNQLENFNPLAYVSAFENLINAESPDLVLFGHTYETRDWVPRLSARLDIPFLTDCIGFKNEDEFVFTRQINQGKINSDVKTTGLTIISIQSGAYRLDSLKSGSSIAREFTVDLSGIAQSIRKGEKFQEAKGSVDLSRAEVIIAVGRGIGKEENMDVIKELAKALNAEIGSSRPVVDYGWLPHEHQVGSSGQTVSPKLYFAIGISGAIQHQVGMKSSDNIIALNKDENAPIFEIADFGVVADLFEIIPNLTEKINSLS